MSTIIGTVGELIFGGVKPKPNSHLFGLEFTNDDVHKELLLSTLEKRFDTLQNKFVKIVSNPNYINSQTIKGLENNLKMIMEDLKKMEESLLYIMKYSNLKPDGKVFGLRLRIDKFMFTLNSYRFLLRYYCPHPDALKYFKFEVNVMNGYVYGIKVNNKVINILTKYRELYKLMVENGELDVY